MFQDLSHDTSYFRIWVIYLYFNQSISYLIEMNEIILERDITSRKTERGGGLRHQKRLRNTDLVFCIHYSQNVVVEW
jgi:hypothetical protein